MANERPPADRLHNHDGRYAKLADGIGQVVDASQKQYRGRLEQAFAHADERDVPVWLPAGTYALSDTIAYRGQSIIGAGSGVTRIVGNPGEDVFRLDPTVSQFARQGMVLRGFTVEVDDSTDASASFPTRGGVGNAGFAIDYADGTAAALLMFTYSQWDDIVFEGSSGTAQGQNASCGIFDQFNSFVFTDIGTMTFERLVYPWWQVAPGTNPTSAEIARDHVTVGKLLVRYCGQPLRIANAGGWHVGQVLISQAGSDGLVFAGDTTAIRDRCYYLDFGEVSIETTGLSGSGAAIAFSGTAPRGLRIVHLSASDQTTAMYWDADESAVDYFQIDNDGNPETVLTVTGDANHLGMVFAGNPSTSYLRSSVADRGRGNSLVMLRNINVPTASRIPVALNHTPAARRQRDVTSILHGYVDPLFVSGNDLLIHPYGLVPSGNTEGVDYDYVVDSSAEFGIGYRHIAAGYIDLTENDYNGLRGGRAGRFLPLGRVRMVVCAKAASAGNFEIGLRNAANTWSSTTTFALTTSYAVYSQDLDLSGRTLDEVLYMVTNRSTAGTVTIGWIGFRPWHNDLYVDGPLYLSDVASAPATPATGGVLYAESGALKYKGSSGTVTTLGVA